MQKKWKVGILGGSGLVGSHWAEQFPEATILLRKPSPLWPQAQVTETQEWPDLIRKASCELWLCTLGTTIKKAGDKKVFESIDHDLVLECARAAKDSGTRVWALVSAHGADPNSFVFYNRVKGKTEESLRRLNFESCLVARPSLLLGDRQESRPLETLSKKIFSQMPWNYLPGTRNIRPVLASSVARHLAEKSLQSLSAPTGFLILESGEMLT